MANYSYVHPELVTSNPSSKFEFVEPAYHVELRVCAGFCHQLFYLCQNRKLFSNNLVKNEFTKDTFCNYISSESFADSVGYVRMAA